MGSPLARAALCLLGVYVALMLFLTARDWIREEYPSRPPEPATIDPVMHPHYHDQAVRGLEKFRSLPRPEQDKMRADIKRSLVPMDQWTKELGHSDHLLIFIGETHRETVRDFLAKEFFSRINLDSLLLEATPAELEKIFERLDKGRDYFPLLGADILAVLRAVRRRNPAVRIIGIEQTRRQRLEEKDVSGSRDRCIARNFWENYQPGKRNVILFGALHCADEPNWLYHNLRLKAPPALKARMLNVYVVEEHQTGEVEAFVWFLDQLGIDERQFVIPNADAHQQHIFDFFPALKSRILDKFSALAVFRRRKKSVG